MIPGKQRKTAQNTTPFPTISPSPDGLKREDAKKTNIKGSCKCPTEVVLYTRVAEGDDDDLET